MYEECFHRERQPDRRKRLSVLRDMGLRFDNTFIIADALDECENIADVLDVLEEMTGGGNLGLHLLATSRELRAIKASFDSSVRLFVATGEVDRDIRAHVQNVLKTDRELSKWRREIQQYIEERLMERCAGM
jgi:hypothetical protein